MEVREPGARYLVARPRSQTELGELPEDWGIHALGALTDPKRPISYGIVQTGPAVIDGVKCLRVVDIHDGRIDASGLITTSKAISDTYKRTVLRFSDLVMPLRGKVGDVALVGGELVGANLTRGVAVIAIAGDVSPRYIKHSISAEPSLARLASAMHGSALQEMPIATLRAFKVALPPSRPEQEAIAGTLSDADALIESLEQLLAKKRQIKQGAMQELLTGQRRLPGFQSPWLRRSLGTLAEMRSGATPSTSNRANFASAGTPWVSIADLTSSGKWIAATERSISQHGLLNCAAQIYPAGTVLYAMYASLGECSIAKVSLTSSQAILGVQPGPALLNEFLYYHLQWVKPQVKGMGQQGTQANLNKGMVQRFQIALPDLAEQAAIATTLSDMDAELTALQARLAKVGQLKQGMAQALLTGRIRLV